MGHQRRWSQGLGDCLTVEQGAYGLGRIRQQHLRRRRQCVSRGAEVEQDVPVEEAEPRYQRCESANDGSDHWGLEVNFTTPSFANAKAPVEEAEPRYHRCESASDGLDHWGLDVNFTTPPFAKAK